MIRDSEGGGVPNFLVTFDKSFKIIIADMNRFLNKRN